MPSSESFFPKVSIIIPVYNGADYLFESVSSALSQTYGNFEVIVVNDGSDDGGKTEEIALSFGDKIRYYKKENGGVSSALNFGIEKMTGDYFSWLSHDDSYAPGKLESSVKLISKFGENKRLIALTGGYYTNPESEKVRDFPDRFEPGKVYGGKKVLEIMLKKGTLNGCCMLIHKNVFEECGLFDEQLRYNQDALLWYRIFSSGYRLVYDGERNVTYRLHSGQTSVKKHYLLEKDSLSLSKKILPVFLKISTSDFSPVYLLALRFAKHKCKSAAIECIRFGVENSILSNAQVFKIKAAIRYGAVRGALKSLYYKAVFNIRR